MQEHNLVIESLLSDKILFAPCRTSRISCYLMAACILSLQYSSVRDKICVEMNTNQIKEIRQGCNKIRVFQLFIQILSVQ
jgi:hypothetical protein